MTFEELYAKKNISNIEKIDLSGWVVFIDEGLFLIEEDFEPDYKNCRKVEISDRDIAYVLQKTLPLVGGGETFLFHKAKAIGKIIDSFNFTISLSELYVEGWSAELEKVDITKENIERCKANSSDLFDTTKNIGNWFDV